MRVSILFTFGKHFTDPIMSVTEETWTYNTCQTATLFIEVHVPSLEIERSCICLFLRNVVWIFILSLSTINVFNFHLHQLNWPLRYNWNIVESGVHTITITLSIYKYYDFITQLTLPPEVVGVLLLILNWFAIFLHDRLEIWPAMMHVMHS